MIPNQMYYNDDTIMTSLIVCCLIALAIVMIPKAMRHRKLVKQSESKKSVQTEEPEVRKPVITGEITLGQSVTDFKERFLVRTDIPSRTEKLVAVRKKYHIRISKIVRTMERNDVTIFSYIDNVLKHHFESYQDEISELYGKTCDDDYLTPKK